MAWLVILSSILVLWVASLCKILHGSLFASKVTFLNDGGVIRRKNVLLVIAHPDDESMFFAPTINYLISEGHNLYVLCMSTGDAEGKGNIRKVELYLASAILRIPVQQVKIVDHPDLQDGFGKMWNWNLLANIIDEETRSHSIDLVRFVFTIQLFVQQYSLQLLLNRTLIFGSLLLMVMVSLVIATTVTCIKEYENYCMSPQEDILKYGNL